MNWNLLVDGMALFHSWRKLAENLYFDVAKLKPIITRECYLSCDSCMSLYFDLELKNTLHYKARDMQLRYSGEIKRAGYTLIERDEENLNVINSNFSKEKHLSFSSDISFMLGRLSAWISNHITVVVSNDPLLYLPIADCVTSIHNKPEITLISLGPVDWRFSKLAIDNENFNILYLDKFVHEMTGRRREKSLFKAASGSEFNRVFDGTSRRPVNKQALKELV